MAEHQIDPETVKRCIEALREAPGVYRNWNWNPSADDYFDTITIDNAVVTLEGLLPPPEKTKAEKLVDEWLLRNGETSEVFINGYYSEHVALAQFVLDRISEKVAAAINPAEALQATAEAMGFDTYSQQDTFNKVAAYCDSYALNDTPRYVYGPWIERHGSECPVPCDWLIETVLRDETVADHDEHVTTAHRYRWTHIGSNSDITHYRVRFEVGKWYDWTGGPCPVDGETRVHVRFRNGHTYDGSREASFWSMGSDDWWQHEGPSDDNIVAFKVVPE